MKEAKSGYFVGGHPALDFVNTVDDGGKSRDKNRIRNWADLEEWAQASGAFTIEHLREIKRIPQLPDNALMLEEIIHLRESAYGMLSSVAAGNIPFEEHRKCVDGHIKTAINCGELKIRGSVCAWAVDIKHPAWLVGTLALLIEDLMRSHEFQKLRECGRCTWLFLDQGRGRGRKWCDMRTCGNRSKSASFKKRQKE